eukprot:TRINITY_DN12974_c0_g1_i1.p1 TRINITY_DN12974_c0_g1~~TRINITY_DN12974_c0_g1_i1.p1  ORF type:complete len:810 (-),score=150.92 TRINITY_DN12974_c0_g1_i1:473-2902(-)
MELPARWSLGYHQCRWSYLSAQRVMEVASTFREKCIPCDVMWMDIDYMDGFRCFTFHPASFGNPKGLADDLHEQNFKAIWMLDPGIKEEPGYAAYDSGNKADLWVLKANGKPFTGNVWPGACRFPDYTMATARSWWADLTKDFVKNGVDGIWNDMNEPSVFNTPSKTMPDTNIHRGDPDLGGKQSHLHYHNVYGMLMARSTWEGMKAAREDKRPFVLTRAAFIGSHRYAATWTGDNLATWEHLHFSIPMALNLGLSGQPFSGPDIGGFAGDSNPRLFARWMGIGALLPFSRGHSETGTRDHEPWSFGPECEAVCRMALERRYRLLPHLYTLFYKAATTGIPVMTPVFFADPSDSKLREVEDEFLLGPLRVVCSTKKDVGANDRLEKAATQRLDDSWCRFHFDDLHRDLPLLYLKKGGIIPSGPVLQSTEEMRPEHPLTLIVALDSQGKAEGSLFEDDGDGYGYVQNDFLLSYFKATTTGRRVTVEVDRVEGQRVRPQRRLVVRLLLGKSAQITAEGTDGEALHLELPSDAELATILRKSEEAEQKSYGGSRGLSAGREQQEEMEEEREPMALKGGQWALKVNPWAGGRIISMVHIPSGREWLESRMELGGYEEYSGTEYRSPGCSEPYTVLQPEGNETPQELDVCTAVKMEGDVGGGVALVRQIELSTGAPHAIQIRSALEAKSVGAGSGGFSRIVCLRVHPSFKLPAPQEAAVRFTAVNGEDKEVVAEFGEAVLKGDDRPNGEWTLLDRASGWALVNRFPLADVETCFVHWGGSSCNLELWSPERPVSADSPIIISHEYEARKIEDDE